MKIKKIIKNRITYFDLVFGIVFFVVALGIFLFFYRKNEYVNIRVRVTDQDVLYANTNPKSWYANRFAVGDTEKNEIGTTISKITGVESFNISGDSKVVYLDINIKAVYDRRTKLYSARGTTLVFGNTLKFNFPNVAFYALITESPSSIKQTDYSEETKTIIAIQRGSGGLEPEILQKIKKGDQIKDSNGNILVQVEDVVLTPAMRVVQTDQGQLLLQNDPYFKDARLTLSVKVKKYKGDEFIFDLLPFKLGVGVPLNFNYESIWPVIIEIK